MMNGQQFAKTTINKQGQQFIRVSEEEWKKGMLAKSKRGFIQVQPDKADEVLENLKSGEIKVAFGDYNKQTQLYTVELLESEVAETEDAEEVAHEA